jgi:flagellar basal-body rod protein FlgC
MADRETAGFVPQAPRLGPATLPGASEPGGVRVLGTVEDPSEGSLVYDPGHPDADQDGYVRMPNVRITDEMVDLMEARRLYEANASVFDAVKSMLRRAAQL